MKCTYNYNGVSYTDEEFFEKAVEILDAAAEDVNHPLHTLAAAVYKLKTPDTILADLKRKGAEAQSQLKRSPDKYISVTSFISAVHVVGGKTRRLTPEFNNAQRKVNYITLHKDDAAFKGDADLAGKAFDEQVELEALNSQVGNYVHKFVSVLLTTGKDSAEYKRALSDLETDLKKDDFAFAKAVTLEDKNLKYTDVAKIQLRILDLAQDIVAWVDKQYPEGTRKALYSEMPMLLENGSNVHLMCKDPDTGLDKDYDGLLGIADLIIVDNNNKVHLIDFKVSSRSYDLWYEAKKNEVDYQMALYRAVLSQAGVDGDEIEMVIKPSVLPKGKISLISSEPSVDLLANTHGNSRVAWRGGLFTAALRMLGIGSQPVFIPENATSLHTAIDEDYNKIMGFRRDPKRVTKELLIEKGRVKEDKDSRGQVIGYKFWSELADVKGGWLKAATMEEFTKEGGILDLYVSDLEQSRKTIVKTIIDEINTIKKGEASPHELFKSDKNVKRANILRQKLGKYTSPLWECRALDFKQLADYGLIVFSTVDPESGRTVLDIVSIAEFNLDDIIDINGTLNVLGKFYTDEEIRKLPIHTMRSSYLNIKAVEAASVLNTLMNLYPDLLSNSDLGNLIILNPHSGDVADNKGVDLNILKENFAELCKNTKGEVKNALDSMSVPTTEEYCMTELSNVLASIGEDHDLHLLLSDIDNGTETLSAKRRRVKELLLHLRDKYPGKLRNKEFGNHGGFDLNDPVQLVYVILSQMNNYLNGVHIEFDGKIDRYSISVSELFSAVGVYFTGKAAQTDTTGTNISGFAGGMEVTSPRTSPSNTLRLLNAYYDIIYSNVRKQFDRQTSYVSRLTKKYISNFVSEFLSLVNSEYSAIWERLLVHDGDQLSSRMMFKNPYDLSNDLTELDREFLKAYLWEVNKYLPSVPSGNWELTYEKNKEEIENLDVVKLAKSDNDSEYFLMPLARADSFQRLTHLKDFGLKNFFSAKWEDFKELYDPRALHNERRKLIRKNDITIMPNVYDISTFERNKLIESVDTLYDFSLDLDYLALDVAFNAIRKDHFDNALMLTETVTAMMELQQQETGHDFSNEIATAQTLAKITLTNESVLEDWQEKGAELLGPLKHFNSFVTLALRPLSFLKELTFGMFTNYSRAWALKYGSNALSIKSVSKANAIVWGQHFGKYGKAFTGEGSLADFTMCESINRFYGIANLDLNRIVKNSSLSRMGKFDNMSKWMYIAQAAPDYFNRLTLFIAKMIEDGCFEAHTLNANGELEYDWKKDKRFDKLAEYGLNSDHADPEYNKLKALYAKMCADFEKGGEDLIKWDKEKRRYIYGDITSAYTSDLKASIKEVSDTAYGFYDHEAKSQLNHKFFGLVFLQFLTFLSAKFNLWFKAPGRRGGVTAQGQWVLMERDGQKYYDRYVIDDLGNLIKTEKVPESELTEEEKYTLLPAMEWKGDFVEGLFYSIGYTLHDLFTLNWKEMVSNKQRLANVMLALHDIILGILLVSILKAIFSNGSNKLQDIKPAKRVLVRAMEDVGPGAFTKISITPSFILTLNTIKSDGIKLMFHDSPEAIESMTKHFGFTRDFYWSET